MIAESKVKSRYICEMVVTRANGNVYKLDSVFDSSWGWFRRWKENRRIRKILGKENRQIGRMIKHGKRSN